MDAQKRVLIPVDLRKAAKLETKTEIALCMKNYNVFFLTNINEISSEDIIIRFVKLDSKGRFSFPHKYLYTANLSNETITLKGNKVYISFPDSIRI